MGRHQPIGRSTKRGQELSLACLPPGYSVAGILSSPNLKNLLAQTSLNLEQRKAALEDLYGSPVSNITLKFLSNINSIFLTNTDTEKLASNVTFKFNFTSVSPRMGGREGQGMPCGSPSNRSQKSGQHLLTYMVQENQLPKLS